MHLKQKKIFENGPKHILVLDFDERIVNSINRFARDQDLEGRIDGTLYNVCDPLPVELQSAKDAFYTNPPWGASNDGQSVTAFVQRGIEATKPKGLGAIVIADDEDLSWTSSVLLNTQKHLLAAGYIVSEMIPGLHKYHLDDAPDLASCCILARDVCAQTRPATTSALPGEALENFYGRKSPLRYRYVKDLAGLNLGKAPDSSYKLIPLEDKL
jgi:predicted methyltransferase